MFRAVQNFRATVRPILKSYRSVLAVPLVVWACLGGATAQEFPGGTLLTRPALVSERGSHPVIVVQTVPQATSTATALIIRYGEPGKVGGSSTSAHLLEHLLFRTRPKGPPGELLLRNEALGDRAKAWLDSCFIVFSEEVPAEHGLASLQLQVERLSGVPKDPEGWKLEKEALLREISRTQSPEDLARRTLLDELGYPSEPAGNETSLKEVKGEELGQLLTDLDLDSDVVIAVVGPHTPREVRQHLSENLIPLAATRSSPRADTGSKPWEPRSLTARSPAGHHQWSGFFQADRDDPRVMALANTLLAQVLAPGQGRLSEEAGDLYRLDLTPPSLDLSQKLSRLTPEISDRVFVEHDREWLKRYESPQRRAEMLALTTLRQTEPEARISREEYPALLETARSLLLKGQMSEVTLLLEPLEGVAPNRTLFDYASIARKEALPNLSSDELPNGLTVTTQVWDTWPTVALSGFFRQIPPLSRQEVAQLSRHLQSRTDKTLEFDVQQGAVFFHGWAPSSQAESLLTTCAEELKFLAGQPNLAGPSQESDSQLVETFFLGSENGRPSSGVLPGARVFSPQGAHLVAVGQFEPDVLERGLRPAWSGWFARGPKGSYPAKLQDLPVEEKSGSLVVDLPQGAQPVLLFGFRGPSRSSPDFLAFNLALQTLAGRPTSSLAERELQKGSAPVDSVRLIPLSSSESQSGQVWVIALRLNQVMEDPTPLCQRLEEMLRALGGNELAEAELARTRDYLKSSLTLSAASNSGRARILAHAEFYRLSRSYAVDFAGLYDHLTPSAVKAVCQRVLENEKPRWLYLRPKE